MLEVLIAILVFSLGVIGLAGLLIFAIQSNHVAYLRTQATFLAHNMAARMGANPAGLWAGDYNGNYPVSASTASCSAGCNPQQLANYDMAQWSTQLTTFLPNVSGNITCSTTGLNYVPNGTQVDMRPPYGGTCTMTLSWNEAGGAGGAQQASLAAGTQGQQLHTFQWVFQP
ncbi:MAG: hypothetical protein OJF55_001378 [Rhodanobacteraceae bacterium]|nr:MAG: hypothetical protein OJF55_001378 [Rhodanobacteraceae bacterium]